MKVSVGIDKNFKEEESQVVTNPTMDIISMSGFNCSPEAKAAQEWKEFCDSYDVDGKLMEEHDDDVLGACGEDVKLYTPYTDEMADQLREIVAKYNLGLHKETATMGFDEFEKYFGGKLIPDDSECFGGYYYDDGTVHFDSGYVDAEGYCLSYQFSRNTKGIFSEDYLNIGDSGEYEQEHYTTKDGTDVVIAKKKMEMKLQRI